jgi:hypothetical protein
MVVNQAELDIDLINVGFLPGDQDILIENLITGP